MTALPPGHRLLHLGRVDSTNAEAARRARAGEPGGLVVRADAQTAGRGRQGRTWVTGPGCLAFTLLRRPDVPPQEAPRWTVLAGLAAVEGLRDAAPDLWLKWPNDVQAGERKVGGILCELDGGAILVGLGLNLVEPPGGWPPPIAARAGVLPPAVGSPAAVLAAVVGAFDRLERELLEDGFAATLARYRRCLAPMLGRAVTIDGGGPPWAGRVHGVDDSGALVVVDGSGAHRTVLAGDVHLLPPGSP